MTEALNGVIVALGIAAETALRISKPDVARLCLGAADRVVALRVALYEEEQREQAA